MSIRYAPGDPFDHSADTCVNVANCLGDLSAEIPVYQSQNFRRERIGQWQTAN